MLKVWDWWNTEKELANILRAMGYDSIQAKEGYNNNVSTYGVLYPNLVKEIK